MEPGGRDDCRWSGLVVAVGMAAAAVAPVSALAATLGTRCECVVLSLDLNRERRLDGPSSSASRGIDACDDR